MFGKHVIQDTTKKQMTATSLIFFHINVSISFILPGIKSGVTHRNLPAVLFSFGSSSIQKILKELGVKTVVRQNIKYY